MTSQKPVNIHSSRWSHWSGKQKTTRCWLLQSYLSLSNKTFMFWCMNSKDTMGTNYYWCKVIIDKMLKLLVTVTVNYLRILEAIGRKKRWVKMSFKFQVLFLPETYVAKNILTFFSSSKILMEFHYSDYLHYTLTDALQ